MIDQDPARAELRRRIRTASRLDAAGLQSLLELLDAWWTAHPDDIRMASEAGSVARLLSILEERAALDALLDIQRPH